MAEVYLLGKTSKGACGLPPTNLIDTPITKTYIEGSLVAGVSGNHTTHSKGDTTHSNRDIKSGSNKSFIEGVAVARKNDTISCGDVCGDGASKTYIG